MSVTNRKFAMLAFGLVIVCSSHARANYAVSVVDDAGNGSAFWTFGSTSRINIVLSGNSVHIANDFTITVSNPGVIITDFSWGDPFVTNGSDDVSVPQLDDLPVTLTADTFYTNDVIDARFSNFLGTGVFGEGTLLSIDLQFPSSSDYHGNFDFNVAATPPDTNLRFLEDFGDTTIDDIRGFTFIHIPEPTSIILFAIAGFTTLRRRRRNLKNILQLPLKR